LPLLVSAEAVLLSWCRCQTAAQQQSNPRRHFQKFRGADAARMHRLTQEQATRLCSVCDNIVRDLVKAAMLAGCRYCQLCVVRANDSDGGFGTLVMLNPHSESCAEYRSRRKARGFSAQ
jgi:hypothetical protein